MTEAKKKVENIQPSFFVTYIKKIEKQREI